MSDDEWTGSEAEIIAAELARCVLGGRGPQRIEQRMDSPGHLARLAIAHRLALSTVAVALLPAMRNAADAIAHTMRQVQAVFEPKGDA